MASVDLFIYGTGFSYKTPADELRDLKKGVKQVTSSDFEAVAKQSGGDVFGVNSMEKLVTTLESTLAGNQLGVLSILGHGTGDAIGLKAKNKFEAGGAPPTIEMDPTALFSVDSLARYRKRLTDAVNAGVDPKGSITLYACKSGILNNGIGLLSATAEVFRLPVFGFKKEIRSCTVTLTQDNKVYIKQRGWFQYGEEVRDGKSCPDRNFVRDMRNLHPDANAQPPQPKGSGK